MNVISGTRILEPPFDQRAASVNLDAEHAN